MEKAQKEIIKQFLIPIIIIFSLSLYLDYYSIAFVFGIYLFDVLSGLTRIPHKKQITIEIKKPLPFNLYLPFFGITLVVGNKPIDRNKIQMYHNSSSECGYIFWYVIYCFEYVMHLLVLVVLFRQWYYEEYRPNLEKISVKFKTLLNKANENVCFNEMKTGSRFEWLQYVLNSTHS